MIVETMIKRWENLPPVVQDSIETHITPDGIEVPLWQERTSKNGARRPWCGCANRGPAWTLCEWHAGMLFGIEALTMELARLEREKAELELLLLGSKP